MLEMLACHAEVRGGLRGTYIHKSSNRSLLQPSAERLQNSACAAHGADLAREIRGMETAGITSMLRLSVGAMRRPLQRLTTNAL